MLAVLGGPHRLDGLLVDSEPLHMRCWKEVLSTVGIDLADPLLTHFAGAQHVVRVRVQRIFPNCPRYIHPMKRMDLSDHAPREGHTPPDAAWNRDSARYRFSIFVAARLVSGALILLAVQTGLRLSELTGLRQDDVSLGTGSHVRVVGKGRKERCTPLSRTTRAVLAAWMREPPKAQGQPLFPNARGGQLSAHGLHYLLAKHVAAAGDACPSLKQKRVTPHVLRHTTAMDLLQQGVEQSVIALWLGHESIETTQMYLDADLALKERILEKTTPPDGKPGRYRPDDRLLAFLKGL